VPAPSGGTRCGTPGHGHGRGPQCVAGATSPTCFKFVSPVSKSLPTILSMLTNTHMNLDMKFIGPSIAHVTLVPEPSGASLKRAVFVALNGFRNSSLIATAEGGVISASVILPAPTLSFPAHS